MIDWRRPDGSARVLVVAALMLGGCDTKADVTLRAENERLRAELDELKSKIRAANGTTTAPGPAAAARPANASSAVTERPLGVAKIEIIGFNTAYGVTDVAFRVTNSSRFFLDVAFVQVFAFGRADEYLGKGATMIGNVRPGETVTGNCGIVRNTAESIERLEAQAEGPNDGSVPKGAIAMGKAEWKR